MELTQRLRLMNWLVNQSLAGLAENDLIRGFCERCCEAGLQLSRGLVFIEGDPELAVLSSRLFATTGMMEVRNG